MILTKICPYCKKEKSIDSFYKRRGNKPASYCKECTSIQALTRQQNFKKQLNHITRWLLVRLTPDYLPTLLCRSLRRRVQE